MPHQSTPATGSTASVYSAALLSCVCLLVTGLVLADRPTTPTGASVQSTSQKTITLAGSSEGSVSTLDDLLQRLHRLSLHSTEVSDDESSEQAWTVVNRRIVELATDVIARTHSFPELRRDYEFAIAKLLDARMALVESGDEAERRTLERNVEEILEHDAGTVAGQMALDVSQRLQTLNKPKGEWSRARESALNVEVKPSAEEAKVAQKDTQVRSRPAYTLVKASDVEAEEPEVTVQAQVPPAPLPIEDSPNNSWGSQSLPRETFGIVELSQSPIVSSTHLSYGTHTGPGFPKTPPFFGDCRCRKCRSRRCERYWKESYYGEPDKWMSRPLGSSIYQAFEANVRSGRQSGELTLFEGDFVPGSSNLRPNGLRKVLQASRTLLHSFDSLLIAETPSQPTLAEARRSTIILLFKTWNVPIDDSRITIVKPMPGLSSREALIILQNRLNQTQSGGPSSSLTSGGVGTGGSSSSRAQ